LGKDIGPCLPVSPRRLELRSNYINGDTLVVNYSSASIFVVIVCKSLLSIILSSIIRFYCLPPARNRHDGLLFLRKEISPFFK
jgi:hypothetical protein